MVKKVGTTFGGVSGFLGFPGLGFGGGFFAPVHDAFLIEANTEDIAEAVIQMQQAMRRASEATLPGFPLRSDAYVVHYPGRFGAGAPMWDRVEGLLSKLSRAKSVAV